MVPEEESEAGERLDDEGEEEGSGGGGRGLEAPPLQSERMEMTFNRR